MLFRSRGLQDLEGVHDTNDLIDALAVDRDAAVLLVGDLARQVGQKKAREIWYLCRQYDAKQALDMGLVNTVVPLKDLEAETVKWCREMLQHSPIALRCLKSALNADCDGQAGLQELAGNATLLFYMTEEGQEGKNAFLERRPPNFKRFKRLP